MRLISIKLPEPLDRVLTELARRRRITRSSVLREALMAYSEQPSKSFAAAAVDLAGSLSGPKDLSCSPRHMSGYGK